MINKVIRTFTLVLLAAGLAFGGTALAGDEAAVDAGPSLYERLGGWDAVNKIVADTIALHQANPDVGHYFKDVDPDALAKHVATFFSAGTGGPHEYTGRDMTTTHADMNLSDADFDSVVEDVLKALQMNGVGSGEQAEVAAILESLRPAVMGTAAS